MKLRIEIFHLVKGAPTVIRTLQHDGDVESGIQALRNIGHSWQYSMKNWAQLKDEDDKVYGILNIFQNTYRVDRIGLETTE